MADLDRVIQRETTDLVGEAMVFQIIETIKEGLSGLLPAEQCSICLLDFTAPAGIVRTECFHYFHDLCLAR